MTTDPIAVIRAAGRNEDTIPVCLHSDLNEQWEQAQRALLEAQAMSGDSLEPSEELLTLARRVTDIEDQMAAQTINIRLRSMPPRQFRKLLDEHPPRRDEEQNADPLDLRAGFNRDTFPPALLRACTVEPQLPDDVWEELLDKLTPGQYGHLTTTATNLNLGDVDVPFSLAASRLNPRSANTSRPPNGSESAPPAGPESNPEPSPPTNETLPGE